MDYDLIVVKTLERVYKNYYYIIRVRNTGDLSWIVSCIRSRRGIFIIMYIFRILMTEQKNMHYM